MAVYTVATGLLQNKHVTRRCHLAPDSGTRFPLQPHKTTEPVRETQLNGHCGQSAHPRRHFNRLQVEFGTGFRGVVNEKLVSQPRMVRETALACKHFTHPVG